MSESKEVAESNKIDKSNKIDESNRIDELNKIDESHNIDESNIIDESRKMDDGPPSIFVEPIKSKFKNKVSIPLLSKAGEKGVPSPDCTTVIHEIFQNKLQEEKLSASTAGNILKSACVGSILGECASYAKATHDNYDKVIADIRAVEQSIIDGYEEHVIRENIISSDPAYRDRIILQRPTLFRDLKKKYVDNYCLIQSNDLLPETHERIIDCRLIENERFRNRFAGNKRTGIFDEKARKPNCELYLSDNSTKSEKHTKEKHHLPILKTVSEPVIFVAKPGVVVFKDCKAGCTYKHIVKLTNVSNRNGRFQLVPLPSACKFFVMWQPLSGHTKIVAPGMAVSIIIQYKGDPYEELLNYLTVKVLGGMSLQVRIETYREPPILTALSFFNIEHELSDKELILAGTIENGFCFVGGCSTTVIMLTNVGGIGRFWICSEESWCFAEVNDDYQSGNILSLPPFTVNPFYFSMGIGEIIELRVTFKPQVHGAQVETLYFLCDNCTVRTIELVGDAIVFLKSFLKFENMEKTFSIDMDDDEDCEHWLDMGTVLPTRSAYKEFTVTNTSGVELAYQWNKRKINIQVFARDILFEVDEDEYNIEPATGIIKPKCSVTFTVTCQLSTVRIGHYRYVLSMIILNIPSGSVKEESKVKVFVPKHYESDMLRSASAMDKSAVSIQTVDVTESEIVDIVSTKQESGIKISVEKGSTSHLVDKKREVEKGRVKIAEENDNAFCVFDTVFSRKESAGKILGETSTESSLFGLLSMNEESALKIPVENPSRSDLVDIVVGEVEVWIQVVPLQVRLKPCIICITGAKLTIGGQRIVRLFTIFNDSDEMIKIKWDLKRQKSEDVRAKIYPRLSEISANCSLPSIITIQSLRPGEFRLKIECDINDGEKVIELIVVGETSGAIVGPSRYNLDFGLVKHGTLASMSLDLINKTNKSAVWQLQEFIYDFKDRCLSRAECSQVTADLGMLCHRGSICHVTYNLITRHTGLFCSLLVLSSLTPDDSTPNAYILVTADIVAPKINITAPIHNNAVLTISNRLFIGLKTSYQITLRNITKIPASFLWGTPTGCDSSCLQITFDPCEAVIPPAENLTINIHVLPQENGEVRHFYVPCFVGREPAPVILSIICNVDCLNVTFHMPKNAADKEFTVKDNLNVSPISWSVRGRDINFPWIKKKRKSKEETCTCRKRRQISPVILRIPETVFPKEFGEINPSTCSIHYKLASPNPSIDSAPSEKSIKVTTYYDYTSQYELQNVEDDIHNIVPENSEGNEDNVHLELEDEWLNSEANQKLASEEQNDDLIVTEPEILEPPCTEYLQDRDPTGHTKEIIQLVPRDVILIEKPNRLKVIDMDEIPPDEEPPEEEPQIILPSSTIPLIEWLRSYAVIEFYDIPCFTPVCRMFVVRNETPLSAVLKVTVCNYPQRETESEIDILAKIQAKLNRVKQDEWKSCIREGSGLVVVAKPSLSFLEGYDVIPVYVWVYADTWGSYMEVIRCELTGLPPFLIKLNIRATGHPVSFPMTLNCTNQRPVLRFGTLPYRSTRVTRKVRISNSSTVALSIAWHIFLKTSNDLPVEEEQPFSVVVDMFTKWSNDGNSIIVDGKCYSKTALEVLQMPYYGTTGSTVFEVTPREVLIPAKGESFFHITVDPSFFIDQYSLGSEELKAALIGTVRISPNSQSQPYLFYRPQGKRLDPVVVQMEVSIDIPHLTLVHPQASINFKVSAVQLISSHSSEPYVLLQHLVFRNDHKSISVSRMRIDEPFTIIMVSTEHEKSTNTINVLPGECVDVLLECKLYKVDALEGLNIIKANKEEFQNNIVRKQYETTLTVDREFSINQNDLFNQVMKLSLTISYPKLQLSTDKMICGLVVLGEANNFSFQIENKSNIYVEYWITFREISPVFTVKCDRGILPPCPQPHLYAGAVVVLTFAPNKQLFFENVLVVKTIIPGDEIEVKLEGYGTINQAYCLTSL